MAFVVFFIQHILVAVERFLVELMKIHKKSSTSELVKEQHIERSDPLCGFFAKLLRSDTLHTSHVTFSRTKTRTRVAQVLACAPHISCDIFMRSCCVFDSLRLLHFLVFAADFLSYRPVFPPGQQHHLPRCGGQIPCALQLMRTLAPLPSTTLSQCSCLAGLSVPCFLACWWSVRRVLVLICRFCFARLRWLPSFLFLCDGRRPKNRQSFSGIPLGRYRRYRGGRQHGEYAGALWRALFG